MLLGDREPVTWHWPRKELAAHYLRMLFEVGSHSTVLFAPRGKGKTEFMTKDVIPMAAEEGVLPIYINFWDDNENPAASMRYAILRAADEAGFLTKMKEGLSRAKADLAFGVNLGIAKFDVKTGLEKKQVEESILFNLRQITDALIKHSSKKLLLVMDEMQTLANKSEHETFVKSLRTLLDERRGKVFSIFTGSSQARLTELFSRTKAPLYNFAQQKDFPALGDDFLGHWLSNIQKIMGGANGLKLEQMREAFILTERNPRIFWSSVMNMIQENSIDILKHTEITVQGVGDLSGMRQRVAELSAFDRAVLKEIVVHTLKVNKRVAGEMAPTLQLFSNDARARIGKGLGVTPTPSQVQGALKRLMGDDAQLIVMKSRGTYEIEDLLFLQYYEEELLGVIEMDAVELAVPETPQIEASEEDPPPLTPPADR